MPGLSRIMKPGAILATNTSSIPLAGSAHHAETAGAAARPALLQSGVAAAACRGRQPRHRRSAGAGDRALFVGAIDRLPLPVKSSPGFLVNRALTPYMLEAMVMLDEKVEKAVIDAAAEKFGMPMGPIELADQVGLDICLRGRRHVALETRRAALPPAPEWLRDKVEQGRTRPEDR